MKTLLLYSSYTDQMSYFDDWADAFKEHLGFQAECINVFNIKNEFFLEVKKKIKNYDLTILHHSMNGDTLKYLKPFVGPLKDRKGKLVSFVGNEVNLPLIGMASKIKNLQELEPEYIATQLLQEAGEWLYQDCKKSKIISLPHALNPRVFFSRIDIKNRKIDIGTRSMRYGVHIGDNDRNNIIQFFYKNASKLGVSVDFGLDHHSQKRFNREEWATFLSSCKATLSTEAGSFYLQRDDQLVKKIQAFLSKKSKKIILPNETVARKIYRQIVPSIIRKTIVSWFGEQLVEEDALDEDFDFNEIYEKFFSQAQKCPVYSKAISSRHFDAIGTQTMHIMYPGRYNDILIPGVHYFELKKDHSNIDELKDCLKNEAFVKKITDSAFDHIISKHTHKNRLDTLLGNMV